MFDKIKEHNFFNTLNIGKVSLNLKKLIKLKYWIKFLTTIIQYHLQMLKSIY
jgi:hypothetical protein